jgi:hypothetical protein
MGLLAWKIELRAGSFNALRRRLATANRLDPLMIVIARS